MIKAGDTVFLKSGGPEMTVGKISKLTDRAECYYYQEVEGRYMKDGYLVERYIPVAALELSPPFEEK